METHDTTKTSAAEKEPSQAELRHNENGEEILDPIPMQPPLGYKRTLSLSEQIAQQVRLHNLALQDDAIDETDEEADDFEVGDDFEPLSPHENDHMPSVKKLKEQAKALNKKIREAQNKRAIEEYEKKKGELSPLPTPAAEPPAPAPTET